jgi:CCR4-NOT transcription complex subunit 6
MRVVSFNTLAQVYGKSSWFQHTDRRLMKWKARFEALTSYLTAIEADIMALQEVDNYAEQWEPWARDAGYASHYVRRTQAGKEKKDGSVVAWKRDAFSLVAAKAVHFNDLANGVETEEEKERYVRDCVANLTLLRRTADDTELLVASTHIFWDPACADVKLAQARMLVEEIYKWSEERLNTSEGNNKAPHVICCGDFNSMPDSDVYNAMVNDGRLGLKSVTANDEPEFTNVTPEFTACIDYVFVSDGVVVESVRAQPTRDSLGAGLPNAEHPSDHLPVVADVKL